MASSSSSGTQNPKRKTPNFVFDIHPNHPERNAGYHVLDLIGTASNWSVKVHFAENIKAEDQNMEFNYLVTVKLVHSQDEPEGFNRLNQEIMESEELPEEHRNIIGITKHFIYRDYLCVVCPRMTVGTVRSYMAKKSPGGLTETCIFIVLREVLNGLVFLHEHGHVHGSISAGTIYLNVQKEIKLGFSASLYDLNYEKSPHLPDDWVKARDGPINSQEYDIWMIGITALELAYGGLTFQEREDFESFLKRLHEARRLPRKEMMRKNKRGFLFKFQEKIDQFTHTRDFSNGFSKLVALCLDPDPSKRPSAADLLQALANCRLNVDYFFNFLDNFLVRQLAKRAEHTAYILERSGRI